MRVVVGEQIIMEPIIDTQEEKKIIGVEARTSNRDEANIHTGKIPALWQKFFQIEASISNRKSTNTILGTYTNYESD
jgi:predicted transcriptional regulator YdeE